ncbi:MAG: hypothetical protein H7240_09405 [Glaciimonas sp.]|nr:hypothetical protein [Glaciimonas sp.]
MFQSILKFLKFTACTSVILGLIVIFGFAFTSKPAEAQTVKSYEKASIHLLIKSNSKEEYRRAMEWVVVTPPTLDSKSRLFLGGYHDSLQESNPISFTISRDRIVIFDAKNTDFEKDIIPNTNNSFGKSSITQIYVVVPSIKANDLIHWDFVRTSNGSSFPGKISFSEYLDYAAITKNFSFEVTAPRDLKLNFETRGFVFVKSEVGKDLTRWSYSGSIPYTPQAEEEGSPSKLDSMPAVFITSFKDWADVGNSYLALEKEALAQGSSDNTLSQMAGDATAPREIAVQIRQWILKNIKYDTTKLSTENKVKPRPLSEVLETRSADCKEMVMLYKAAMRDKGIEVHTIGVNASGTRFRKPNIPIYAIFDHVIAFIPSLDIYVDIADSSARFGVPSAGLLGTPSLDFETGVFAEISASKNLSTSKSTETITIGNEGTVTSEVRIIAKGHNASYFEEILLPVVNKKQDFKSYLKVNEDIEANTAALFYKKIGSDDNEIAILSRVVFNEKISLASNSSLILYGSFYSSIAHLIPYFPSERKRVNPRICTFSDIYSEDVIYSFSVPVTIELQTEAVSLESPPFKYVRSVEFLNEKSIKISRKLTRESGVPICSVNDYEEWGVLQKNMFRDYKIVARAVLVAYRNAKK